MAEAASVFKTPRARRQSMPVQYYGDNATHAAVQTMTTSLAECVRKATDGAVTLVGEPENVPGATHFPLSRSSLEKGMRARIEAALPYGHYLEMREVAFPDETLASYAPKHPTLVIIRPSRFASPGLCNLIGQVTGALVLFSGAAWYLFWHLRLDCALYM